VEDDCCWDETRRTNSLTAPASATMDGSPGVGSSKEDVGGADIGGVGVRQAMSTNLRHRGVHLADMDRRDVRQETFACELPNMRRECANEATALLVCGKAIAGA
jgi:hypothetical protein